MHSHSESNKFDSLSLTQPHTGINYIQKIFHYKHVDWEFAFVQLWFCYTHPQKLYQYAAYRREAKRSAARDDPGFMILIMFFLAVNSLAYCFGLQMIHSLTQLILSILLLPLLYVMTSCLVFLIHYIVLKLFSIPFILHLAYRSTVVIPSFQNTMKDWMYCFDVHSNSLPIVCLLLGPIQYILLPFFLYFRSPHLTCFVSSLLYAAAFLSYIYTFLLGYISSEHIDSILFFPITPILLLSIIICTFLPFNPTLCFISFTQYFMSLF
jgi:hypothetical protein